MVPITSTPTRAATARGLMIVEDQVALLLRSERDRLSLASSKHEPQSHRESGIGSG